ncbi:MAG: hypothetical protein M5R36_25900 [Deltaproteobacteria bacterium]|nr:hypothetical protein [Deltaproteobacteria bacterium]
MPGNIGVDECTIANWERRGMRPHIHATRRRVAEFFGVGVAEMLGVKPVPNDARPKYKLLKVRECLGMSQREMGKLLGLTEEQYHWTEFEGKKGTRFSHDDLQNLLGRIPEKYRAAFDGIFEVNETDRDAVHQ